jgi:hypothetical protein
VRGWCPQGGCSWLRRLSGTSRRVSKTSGGVLHEGVIGALGEPALLLLEFLDLVATFEEIVRSHLVHVGDGNERR